jgi:hypothetical protein
MLRTPLSWVSATLFASLGLPVAACGQTTTTEAGRTGEEGDGAAPAHGGANTAGASGSGPAPSSGGHETRPSNTSGETSIGGFPGSGGEDSGASLAGTGGQVATGGSTGSAGTGSGTGGSLAIDAGGYLPCRNPTPLLGPGGEPTGYVECDGSSLHRTAQVECPSTKSETACTFETELSNCTYDSDCTASPNGYCSIWGCICHYGCAKDSDCGEGAICLCGDPVGRCAPATCVTDDDCEGLCLSYHREPIGCTDPAFACQDLADVCASDADCGPGACSIDDGVRTCRLIECVIGRPFLVAGEIRRAGLVRDAGVAHGSRWASRSNPDVSDLSAATRRELAQYWAEVASMEHASVAAFARFCLELLSLGAGPDLVTRTQGAIRDETQHARDAFGLATAYAGEPLAPAALVVEDALHARNPLVIVRTAILEGCIGETVAAVEATEALARATDPAVREILARTARDEMRHAELAWSFVAWVLRAGPANLRTAAAALLTDLVESELAQAQRHAPGADAAAHAPDPALAAHGALDAATRTEVRLKVLSEVIDPCTRALVAADADTSRSRGQPVEAALCSGT